MTTLQELYRWEAKLRDGSVIDSGGDLSDAVRVSLIPAEGTGLPRHDLIGMRFGRRFTRYFKRMCVGGFDRDRYLAEIERQQGPQRKAARCARDAKGYVPPTSPDSSQQPSEPAQDVCLSVVVAEEARFYLNHATGAALVSPPDYELYL
jgi:hypothetical protein